MNIPTAIANALSRKILDRLAVDGFVVVPDVISRDASQRLAESVDLQQRTASVREKAGRIYAVRNLLTQVPNVTELVSSSALRAVVEPTLGAGAFPVRAILFDKTADANWKVAWHQDLSIAVRERAEVPGFGPWSIKAGVQHVQPPVDILQEMLTVRLHLDDCDETNGPLLVLPGSHASGVLSPEAIDDWRKRVKPVACVSGAGGVLLMRPLLLHASSSAVNPRHRRVVHIEFASRELSGGLRWAVERV